MKSLLILGFTGVVFLAQFHLSGCYKESDYNRPVDTSVVKPYADSLTLLADGYTLLNLYCSIPIVADDSLAQISFRTTSGLFPDANQQIITVPALKTDSNIKVAQVSLRSSLVVDSVHIFVTTKVFGYKKVLTVNFVRSYPDKLIFSASSLLVNPKNDKNGEVAFSGNISKQKGKPSIGDSVQVYAYDSLYKKHIGSFRQYNNTSDSIGNVSYIFVLGDSVANRSPSSYIGPLYVVAIAKAITTSGFISDTVKIISSR